MVVAEDVAWAGAGTKLRSFRYIYSGAAVRVAPAFFSYRVVLSLVRRAIRLTAPVFPRWRFRSEVLWCRLPNCL